MDDRDAKKLLDLANIHGTPLYVYDFEKIERSIKNLKMALPKYANIFYSMKCNPNYEILKSIKEYVGGIEVASEGELFLAIEAGVSSKNIIFVGPGKTHAEIKYAVESDILSIVAESMDEIELIDKISGNLNKITTISIRINPKRESTGARIKMGGVSKQFGIDEEKIDSLLESAIKLHNVKIEGIHVYMGTQILQQELIINNVKNIFEIARRLQKTSNIKIKLIDFGGGFGVPYFEGEKPLDITSLNKELESVFLENIKEFSPEDVKFIFESGRYLVAESGIYLTKVLYKKESRGKTFIITDGGSNHHSAAAGIGRFIRNNFPIDNLNGSNVDQLEVVDIVGKLCTPTDILAQNIELQRIEKDHILAIRNSGAYALTASPLGFISHLSPAEVMVNKDKTYVIRERGKKEELLIK